MNLGRMNDERRSNSQVLPRIYLLLQLLALMLASYLTYTLLLGLGASSRFIIAILILSNAYLLGKYFFKCRSVIKRNNFSKRFI